MKKKLLLIIFFLLIMFNITNVNAETKTNIKYEKKNENVIVTFGFNKLDESVNVIKGKITYDDNVFEKIEKENIKLLNNWESLEYNPNTNEFIAYNLTGTKNKEDIIKVTFKIKDKEKLNNTKIKITDTETSNGKEDIILSDSEINIKENNVKIKSGKTEKVNKEKMTENNFKLLYIVLIIFILVGIILLYIHKRKTKIMILLITLSLTYMLIYKPTFAKEIKGNFNNDNVIDLNDANILEKYLINLDNIKDIKEADINNDGNVTITDLSELIKILNDNDDTIIIEENIEPIKETEKITSKNKSNDNIKITEINNNESIKIIEEKPIKEETKPEEKPSEKTKPEEKPNKEETKPEEKPSKEEKKPEEKPSKEETKEEESEKHDEEEKNYKSTRSIYAWGDATLKTGEEREEVYNNLKELKVNTIYQNIFSYNYNKPETKETIKYYKERGIDVYSLLGDPSWAYDRLPDAKRKVDEIGKYNESAEENEKIKGVVFDVEPHAYYLWKQNKESSEIIQNYFTNYKNNMIDLYNYSKKYNLEVVISIPVWYEKYDGFDELFEKAADTYSLMNYGKNGNTRRIREEVEEAEKYGKKVESTLNVSDSENYSVNYRQDGMEKMIEDEKKILDTYDYKYLRGSFHQYRTVIELMKDSK